MRVAAVQMTTTLDKEANLRLVTTVIRKAAADGAGLVVLPEATMCSFGNQTTDLVPLAEPLDGRFVGTLHELAVETGAVVVAGMFEPAEPVEPSDAAEPAETARQVRNTVVAVGPDGLLGAYRKFHLYDALGWKESDQIQAGDPEREAPLVFSLGDLTIGVMNCYDLRFPEMARILVDAGSTVLVEPAHWVNGPGKAETWTVLLRARAIESTAYIVAAAKPEPECAGHSMVVDPLGRILESLGGSETGKVVVDLSAEEVAEVRRAIPVLENRRFEVRPRARARPNGD